MTTELLVLAGDFNIHVNVKSDNYVARFLDLLSSMGLQQRIDKCPGTQRKSARQSECAGAPRGNGEILGLPLTLPHSNDRKIILRIC